MNGYTYGFLAMIITFNKGLFQGLFKFLIPRPINFTLFSLMGLHL